MEKYSKRFTVEEVRQIFNKHMGVTDTRIFSLSGHGGLSWEGIEVLVYDEPEEPKESEEDLNLAKCEQCGEPAWDGYICHSCGMKII